MHKIDTRKLTAEEASSLRSRSAITVEALLFIIMLAGVPALVGYGIGRGIEWVLGASGIHADPWVSYSLAVLLGAPVLAVLLWRGVREQLRAPKRIRSGIVEVIRVDGAQAAVWIREYDEEVPCVVIDIGGGKVLFLMGQWMYDPHVFTPYGANRRFPAESFTLHRFAEDGDVLRVEVTGRLLGRLREVTLEQTGLKKHDFEDFMTSVILDGSLDHLFDEKK